jgi:hypothetical protein
MSTLLYPRPDSTGDMKYDTKTQQREFVEHTRGIEILDQAQGKINIENQKVE